MVKIKIFGVLRTTIGFGYLELSAKSVSDVFAEISKTMEKRYIEKQKESESDRKKVNPALEPHKAISFGDAIVFVNGERCMRKRMKLSEGDEIWLLSPAAGG